MIRSSLIGALAVALSAALLVSADRGPGAGPAVIDADEVARAHPEAGAAFRELDARIAEAQHRIGLRREVARDLVAGRVTLGQAADRFREMNEAHPAALHFHSLQFPSATEEELLARQVLGFVRALGYTDPAAQRALPALEAEVARRFPPSAAGTPTL